MQICVWEIWIGIHIAEVNNLAGRMWGNFEAHLLEIGLTALREEETMAVKITEPINQLYNPLFVSIFLINFP